MRLRPIGGRFGSPDILCLSFKPDPATDRDPESGEFPPHKGKYPAVLLRIIGHRTSWLELASFSAREPSPIPIQSCREIVGNC